MAQGRAGGLPNVMASKSVLLSCCEVTCASHVEPSSYTLGTHNFQFCAPVGASQHATDVLSSRVSKK